MATNSSIFNFSMKKERSIYLFLLVILGIIMANILRDDADLAEIENKRFWIRKTHSKDQYPILFGGDSRIYRGISPAEFEKELPGMKAINLGYSSLGYNLEYLKFMENRLDRSAEMKIIVLGISPDPFSKKGFRAESFFRERDGRKKEEIIQYLHFYQFNKLFLPFDFESIISGDVKKKSELNYQMTYHPDGWIESHWLKSDTTFYLSWINSSWQNNLYDEVNTAIFLRKVKEWTDNGIKVAAFRTPAVQSVMFLEDSLSGFPVDEFKARLIEAGGDWIDIDPHNYSTYDGNHVEHESALRLSRNLADAIRKLYFEND